jgi:hypothetical protein
MSNVPLFLSLALKFYQISLSLSFSPLGVEVISNLLLFLPSVETLSFFLPNVEVFPLSPLPKLPFLSLALKLSFFPLPN